MACDEKSSATGARAYLDFGHDADEKTSDGPMAQLDFDHASEDEHDENLPVLESMNFDDDSEDTVTD